MPTYIYTLSDPITLEIRYVGKTDNLQRRFRQHKCVDKGHKMTHCRCWIKSLRSLNLLPIMEILEECNETDWIWLERYWISQLRQWGHNVVNHTEGGEGISGWHHTESARLKIRVAGLGRIATEKQLKALNQKGKKRSVDYIKRLSERLKGNTPWNIGLKTPEGTKKLQSLAKLGKPSLKRKAINQYTLDGKFIKTWESITKASEELSITRENIIACIKGRRNKVGGYKWSLKK